jgi:hypothetical protein
MAKFARRMMFPIAVALALWCAVPALATTTKARWDLGGVPLTESSSVKMKGTLTLTDPKVPIVKSLEVKCDDEATGTAGSDGAGTITKMTVTSCTGTYEYEGKEACEKEKSSLAAMNLPWSSELTLVEEVAHDLFKGTGKEAGLKLKCRGLGAEMEDECKGTLGTTVKNVSGNVTATFNASEKLTCTQGGTASGTLEGTQTIEGVSLENEAQPSWLRKSEAMTESKPVEWSGTISLKDGHGALDGPITVECKDTVKGTAGPKAAGEVTSVAMSGCTSPGTNPCSEDPSLEARNLPWKTELASLSGIAHDLLDESGGVLPALKLTCADDDGLPVAAECKGGLSGPLSNLEHGLGVTALFGAEEEEGRLLPCSVGGSGTGRIESSQTIKLVNGETFDVS